jgi:choline kinase
VEEYRVSILAAGRGSRFGIKSTYSHKALFRLGQKAVISHIIDLFPSQVTCVIALGHNGNLIQQYVKMFHPNRRFIFVSSLPFGRGYGPGYSLGQCRHELEIPFYSFACDTVVGDFVLDEQTSWVGYSRINQADAEHYCTLEVNPETQNVKRFIDKKRSGTDKAWIGLAFIHDPPSFWKAMEKNREPVHGEIQISPALASIPCLKARRIERWYDTGNERGLKEAKKTFGGIDNLGKDDEEIYFNETSGIKYFYDKEIVAKKIKRAQYLAGVIPDIEDVSENFYKYRFARGTDLSRVDNPDHHILAFLEFAAQRLWRDASLTDNQLDDFKRICRKFYRDKTNSRLAQFYSGWDVRDEEQKINNIFLPPLRDILERAIDWEWLCDGRPSTFHGDLNMSNIILRDDNSFTLVDFREEFGENQPYGDRHYDLAKLYQGLIWPHASIRNGDFHLKRESDNSVTATIEVSRPLVRCQELFHAWAVQQGYDVQRIKVLAALTLLNISPLHGEDLGEHLYFLGRHKLWQYLHA